MSPAWLNPADHFTLLMDHQIRASGLAGNYCALVLELAGAADADMIARRCAEFVRLQPLAVARLRRRGGRYAWHCMPGQTLPFDVEQLPVGIGQRATRQRVLEIVNRHASVEDGAPFELHLLQGNDSGLLVLRWFHPATDAKGAELLLHHVFGDEADPQAGRAQQPSPLAGLMQRWSWWRKLVLCRRAVGNIRRLDQRSSVLPPTCASAASGDAAASDTLAQRLIRYERDHTATILSNARQQAGMTGTTLYLIGCMMRALERSGAADAADDGDAYCIPYAANLRRRKALTPIFGNQVSFLFAQAGRELMGSRQRLFAHLREQHRLAIRTGLDHAMLPLMLAGSWLPLEKYARIVRESPQQRERSSFWFSYTGEMEPQPQRIAGCAVQDMYQLSPVTASPGLGLLASLFNGRLTLSYSYVGNALDSEWVERLSAAMTIELLDGDASL